MDLADASPMLRPVERGFGRSEAETAAHNVAVHSVPLRVADCTPYTTYTGFYSSSPGHGSTTQTIDLHAMNMRVKFDTQLMNFDLFLSKQS